MQPLSTDTSSLDLTKNKVMVANNAQTIFDHLKEIGNDTRNRQRWLWELMQNAQDSGGNEIEVIYADNAVTFIHNGKSFSEDDITHLIFHGSSKPGLEGKTGKFGTGFMTTHLLSRKVQVIGDLEDGRHFDFLLDRNAVDAPAMALALEDTWQKFKTSLKPGVGATRTSFTYLDLNDIEGSTQTVTTVLESLPLLISPVMAFSNINKAIVHSGNEKYSYQKKPLDSRGTLQIYRTGEKEEDNKDYFLAVRSIEGTDGYIAIPVTSIGAISTFDSNLPRLFINFPLIGTELAFPLPFLIHSPDFEPSRERQKIWVGTATTPETINNKKIIEKALSQYLAFITEAIEDERQDIHLLADMGCCPAIDWLDTEWYRQIILLTINALEQLPLIKATENVEEKNQPLAACRIPVELLNASGVDGNELWNLCSYLTDYKIPEENKLTFWRKVIINNAVFQSTGTHSSSITFFDLCKGIDDTNENKLSLLPCRNITPLAFIQLLVKDLESLNLEKFWSEFAILPDQTGTLKKSGALKQELVGDIQEIGEQLKLIAAKFNIPTKSVLLDNDVSITSADHKLAELKRDDLLNQMQGIVRAKQLTEITESFELGSIELLAWLFSHNLVNDLTGYPVKMKSDKWAKLFTGKEMHLFPISLWKTVYQEYAELFPDDYILSDLYAGILKVEANAIRVAGKGLLRSPLYKENGSIASEDILQMVTRRADKDLLSKYDNATWNVSGEFELSKIAFLSSPADENMVDYARKSKTKTTKLLEFIVSVLLKEDEEGFKRKEITITNGDITSNVGIYPSTWLLQLKKRAWIKEPGATGNGSRPSVEALLPYFKQSVPPNLLYGSLVNTEVSRFLHFLDIGVGDLLRNIRSGSNEDLRIEWDQSYVAILMNSQLSPEKVKTLLGDPAFIQRFEVEKEQNRLRDENQKIGADVEEAFKEAFKAIQGLKIKRDPIGNDFIVETDFPSALLVQSNEQTKFYIEIKSARTAEVRMTTTQGSKATDKGVNYILCVVPLEPGIITKEMIIKNARFVLNIGTLLENRVEKVREINKLQAQALEHPDADIWTAFDGMNIRYVVSKKVWGTFSPTVLTLSEFINAIVTQ